MNYVRCTLADPTIFIARILYNTVVEKNKTKAKNAAMLSLGTNRRKKNHLEFEKTLCNLRYTLHKNFTSNTHLHAIMRPQI